MGKRQSQLREAGAVLSPRLLSAALQDRRARLQRLEAQLSQGLTLWLARQMSALRETAARLTPRLVGARLSEQGRHLQKLDERLAALPPRLLRDPSQRLAAAGAMLQSLSFERVLERGYAVVYDDAGNIVSSTAAATDKMTLRLKDGDVAVRRDKK